MKRCPKCGNTEPSSSRFCTACGAPLDDVRQNPFRQEEDLVKKAPTAWENPEERIEKPRQQTPAQPPQRPRKRKKKAASVIIPVVVIILIVAIVGVALAVKLHQDNKKGQEQPQESITPETNLPTGGLNDIFESETPSPLTETPAQETPVVETPPAETPQATEAPAESQPSDVWTPVNQTGDSGKTTHTYDGVTIQGDYVFADSNSRYLSESELTGLTKQELAIARNEIYARRGRKFTTDALQKYFDSCDWYTGRYSADSFDSKVTLNDYEKKNATLILDYEKKMGYK